MNGLLTVGKAISDEPASVYKLIRKGRSGKEGQRWGSRDRDECDRQREA